MSVVKDDPTTRGRTVKELENQMKSIFVLGAITLSMTLSGVALAADAPAPAAPPPAVAVDPLTGILTPIGDGLNIVVQPLIVAPLNAVTPIIAPPAPPAAPAAPAPAHHHRHHRHHHPM